MHLCGRCEDALQIWLVVGSSGTCRKVATLDLVVVLKKDVQIVEERCHRDNQRSRGKVYPNGERLYLIILCYMRK